MTKTIKKEVFIQYNKYHESDGCGYKLEHYDIGDEMSTTLYTSKTVTKNWTQDNKECALLVSDMQKDKHTVTINKKKITLSIGDLSDMLAVLQLHFKLIEEDFTIYELTKI